MTVHCYLEPVRLTGGVRLKIKMGGGAPWIGYGRTIDAACDAAHSEMLRLHTEGQPPFNLTEETDTEARLQSILRAIDWCRRDSKQDERLQAAEVVA